MFCFPMKTGTFTKTSGYGQRWGSLHAGTDYAAPEGTPIYAAADGVVVQGKDRAQGSVQGFGSWIWIDSQTACAKDFIYGHVKHDGILVKAGDRVRAGQQIGVVGNEGQSTGAHLHFEVWTKPGRTSGKAINPDSWLTRAGAVEPGTRVLPTQPTASPAPLTTNGVPTWVPDTVLLSPNTSGPRSLNSLLWIIIHTDESAYDYAAKRVRDTGWTAKRLAEFQQSPSAGGSYTGAADEGGKTARIAPDGTATWSTGNEGNFLGINVCFAGTTAYFTREQWLRRMDQLRTGARIVAHWAAKYNIPVRKLQPGDMRRRVKGIGGHDDARELGSTTHWDPGPGFPWDVFINLVKEAGTGVNETQIRAIVADEVNKYFTAQVHTSMVAGSKRRMSLVEMIRLIDLHVHETRKGVEGSAPKINGIEELLVKLTAAVTTKLENKET